MSISTSRLARAVFGGDGPEFLGDKPPKRCVLESTANNPNAWSALRRVETPTGPSTTFNNCTQDVVEASTYKWQDVGRAWEAVERHCNNHERQRDACLDVELLMYYVKWFNEEPAPLSESSAAPSMLCKVTLRELTFTNDIDGEEEVVGMATNVIIEAVEASLM
jgi:hypothetical protein